MKKETIFKHELNESIQTSAALNCLKNRNNHKQLNESADFDARFEFRKDLRELASPVAKKAYMIIRKQYGDSMWRQLGMDDCDEQGLIDMLNMYAEDGLNPQQIVNKMMGVREDEETVDYAQLADDVCASYRGPLSKLDLKDSINYIIKMVAKKIGKTIDELTPQELTAIQKAAKHSVWYVSEQEELTVEQEEMPQMERHDMILALTYCLDESFGVNDNDGDLDDIYYAVARFLNLMTYYTPESEKDIMNWCREWHEDIAEIINTPADANVLKRFVDDAFECLLEEGGCPEFYDLPKEQVKQAIYKALCNTPESELPWGRHYAINSWTKANVQKIRKFLTK